MRLAWKTTRLRAPIPVSITVPMSTGVSVASLSSSSRMTPDADSVVAASIDVVAASVDDQARARVCGVALSNIEMSQDENGAVNGNATSRTSDHALTLRIESEITSWM